MFQLNQQLKALSVAVWGLGHCLKTSNHFICMPYNHFVGQTMKDRVKRYLMLALLLSGSYSFAKALPLAPTLEIINAPPALLENIKAHLNLDSKNCDLTPALQQVLQKKIRDDVRRASEALGYYQLKFSSIITDKDGCWKLALDIEPGEPVLFEKIDIIILGDALYDPEFSHYLSMPPIKTGQQLNQGHYTKLKNDLSAMAIARGYFNAKFLIASLQVNVKKKQANITIHYDTGQRIEYGSIGFPETVLSTETLNRYSSFKTGEPYDSEDLTKLQRALDNSSYFSQVRVYPKSDAIQANQVPIQIELTAHKQHTYRFGLGVDTDTGPRLRFNYNNRYINDKGHKLNYDLNISPVRSETNLNYSLPLQNPTSEHLNFYSGFLREETETSKKDLTTLGTAYSHILLNDWLQTIFLNFQREDFIISNKASRTDLLIPGISWSKTQAQDLLYPLRGWRIQTRIRGTSENLASDISFFQAYASAKAITSIGPGRLLTRLEIGATKTEQINSLPASIRFFAGGDHSVRGYDYQTLGPSDENGEVVGGSHLFVGSLEYDIRINRQWAIAAFYDQGNAFEHRIKNNFKRGAGLGLRWLSPIGPIRLDIARALDDDHGISLHLSMGPDL